MIESRSISGAVLLGAVLAGAASVPASAEVGVAVSPSGFQLLSYVMEGIVDDPEPVGNAWLRLTPEGTTDRAILNEEGYANGDGDPSLIVATGVPVVAWARNSPVGYDVVVSRFVGEAWTVPQPIANGPTDELDPYLAVDPQDGSIHVVYWIHDTTPRVMHRQAPADLSSWSAPVQVSMPGEIACRPSVALYQGDLHVAYEVHDFGYGTTPRQIVVATEQVSGFEFQTLAMTYFAGDNRPIVHAMGNELWIDWIDAAGEMAWRRQQSSGTWESVLIEPFATSEERDYHVRGVIRRLALD